MASSIPATTYQPTISQPSALQAVPSNNQVNKRAPLPSVLAPHPLPSMPYSTATSHLISILSQQQNQCLPLLPRPVTIVHYDVTGAPIISPHLLGIDEFILTSEFTLQLLVLHVQGVLDTKMGVVEGEYKGKMGPQYEIVGDSATQDTMIRKGKLLVSSIEVRGGGERFFKEFPGIMGGIVWSEAWKTENGRYDGRKAEHVMWNHDGGQLQMYWEYYRMMVMKGIMLQIKKPILKVRTVRRVTAEGAGLVAGGHIFTRIIPPQEEMSLVLVKDEDKDKLAIQLEAPPCLNITDLSSLDAPEFQVAMLFQNELKNNGNSDLESIYTSFLQQGGQPMRELIFKSNDGYSKEAAWVIPDDEGGQDDGSNADTIRAGDNLQAPADAGPILPSPVANKQREKFVEAEEAAISFDEKDDDLYFRENGKPRATCPAKGTQQRRRHNTLINRFRSRVQEVIENKSKAGNLNKHNKSTPNASSRYSSPGVGHPSIADSPTPSTKSNNPATPNVQLTSPAQILQPGSTAETHRSSPLTRVAATSQLRPESPAFNFSPACKTSDNKPANWNFGLLSLFNGNEATHSTNATNSGPRFDVGYPASQANLNTAPTMNNTEIGPNVGFHGSKNDTGMGFGASMIQNLPAGAEQNSNFQNPYPDQNVFGTMNTDTGVNPYLQYPNYQQGQGIGFNPNQMQNPFDFNNLYSNYQGASLNASAGANNGTEANFGMGGYPSDSSDPSNSTFRGNLNPVNGFGGTM